jgi:biotin carboxyl carrier protein
MEYAVYIEGRRVHVRVGEGSIEVEGVSVVLDPGTVGSRVRSVLVDGRSLRVVAERNGAGGWQLEFGGKVYGVEVLDRGQEAVRQAKRAMGVDTGPTPFRAPMPGLVVKVEVKEGDVVAAGDRLLIVEAMKMENELRASAPGTVRKVTVAAGDTVKRDQVLIEFDPPGGEA